MKKTKNQFIRIFCLVAVLAISLWGFCACGAKKSQSLEEMINENPEMATEIESAFGEIDIDTEGVSPSLSYKGNTINISLKYDKTYKDDEVKVLKKAFEESSEVFDTKCLEAVSNIKSSTDLKKIKIKVAVQNGDGSELWTKTYDK